MIDPRADVHPNAQLAEDVQVGPWTIIGEQVSIDAGTVIGPHVIIQGPTKIGKNNRIYPFVSIGSEIHSNERVQEGCIEIGDHNLLMEFCFVSFPEKEGKRAITQIGNDSWLHSHAYVGPSCRIGNSTHIVNNTTLESFSHIGSHVRISAFVTVRSFCRIWDHAEVGMSSNVEQDLLPYFSVDLRAESRVGIRKSHLLTHLTPEAMDALRKILHLFRKKTSQEILISELKKQVQQFPSFQCFIDAVSHPSPNGYLHP